LSAHIKEVVHQTLRPAQGDQIVDLGCGGMPYRSFFEIRGCTYLGCDLDDAAPVRIEPGLPVPLPDRSADGVVSFQVLEHVWDLPWYLGECHRLLRPNGWLLLSTHGAWLYHPHPTDFRRWTADGLEKELSDRGFRVERIMGLVGPLAWTTQFRLLGYREVLRRIPLLGGFLTGTFASLMNLRMRLEDAITPRAIEQNDACMYVVVARPVLDPPD
jgi:SAM-dependent methyltransferase